MKIKLPHFPFLIFLLGLTMLSSCQKKDASFEITAGEIVALAKLGSSQFEHTIVGHKKELRIILINNSKLDYQQLTTSFLVAPFSFLGGGFPGEGGDCSHKLVSLARCSIMLEFMPTANTNFTQDLTISYHNGVDPAETSFVLIAKGIDPAQIVILSGDNLTDVETFSFGDKVINGHFEAIFRLENRGGATAKNIVLNDFIAPLALLSSNCGPTLKTNESCDVLFAYDPLNVEFLYSFFVINYYNGEQDLSLSKTIQGQAMRFVARLLPDNISFDFEKRVVDSDDGYNYTFILKNEGLKEATSISAQLVDTNQYSFSHSCPQVLAAGDDCSFIVNFRPQSSSLNILQNNLLRISYSDNAAVNPEIITFDLNVSGRGVAPAQLIIDAASSSFEFAEIPLGTTAADLVVNIKNVGGYVAKAFSLSHLPLPFSIEENSSCLSTGKELLPGSICTLRFAFAPQSGGLHSLLANTLTYNDGSQLAKELPFDLLGTGITVAEIIVSSKHLGEFTKLLVEDTKHYPLTYDSYSSVVEYKMTNTGTDVASLLNLSIASAGTPFAISLDSCSGVDLGIGQSCQFYINFSPLLPAPGESSYNNDFIIKYDNARGGGVVNIIDNYLLAGETSPAADLKVLYNGSAVADPYNLNLAGSNPGLFSISVIELEGLYLDVAVITDISLVAATEFSLLFGQSNASLCNAVVESLAKAASCQVQIKFSPPAATSGVVFNDQLKVTYKNSYGETKIKNIQLSATSENRGVLQLVDVSGGNISLDNLSSYHLGEVGVGNNKTFDFKVVNIGLDVASNLLLPSLVAPFSYAVAGNASCIASMAPAAECTFSINFSPVVKISGDNTDIWKLDFDMLFDDSIDTAVVHSQKLAVTALTPAILKIKASDSPSYITAYNFRKVPENLSSSMSFTIKNIGDASTLISFALFTSDIYTVINNTCDNTTLNGKGQNGNYCSFEIEFRPNAISVFATIAVNFSDDNANPYILDLEGEGIEAIATFNKWSKIIAYNKTSQQNKASIHLAWNPPTLIDNSFIIAKYNIYRDQSVLNIDAINNLEVTPYKTTLNPFYTDTDLNSNQIYYYTIRPVIDDGGDQQQKIVAVDAHIKVIAPPTSMALIHPKMANLEICSLMGYAASDLDVALNYACDNGTTFGGLSWQKSIFVDLFELGVSGNDSGQLPVSSNQFEAQDMCASSTEEIDNKTYTKRLLNRQEQFIATRETDKMNCNINSSAAMSGNSSSSCYSFYHIYDLVGNLSEWTLDWILSAQVVKNNYLDQQADYNTPLLGTAINHQHAEIQNVACFSFSLGLPFAKSSSLCSFDSIATEDLSLPLPDGETYYSVLSNGTISGARGMLGGGSFNSGDQAGRFFVDLRFPPAHLNQEFGVRCGFSL